MPATITATAAYFISFVLWLDVHNLPSTLCMIAEKPSTAAAQAGQFFSFTTES